MVMYAMCLGNFAVTLAIRLATSNCIVLAASCYKSWQPPLPVPNDVFSVFIANGIPKVHIKICHTYVGMTGTDHTQCLRM